MGITTQLNGNRAKSTGAFLASITNKMAFIIAIGGGIITAILTMLIPTSALETFTGASGLSEIIPATAAPLGGSAKTLFVIFTAILASAILLVLLLTLRKEPEEDSIYADDDYIREMAKDRNRMALARDNIELAERNNQHSEMKPQNYNSSNNPNYDLDETRHASQKRNFADIASGSITKGSKGLMALSSLVKSKINKLPFLGGDDSVRSFDDLPKLRGADRHPDAPARRPLSANEDLGKSILDRDWSKEDSPNYRSENKISNIDQSLYQDMAHQDSHDDDIHLQPLYVEEELNKARDYTKDLEVKQNPVSIDLNGKHNINSDENSEKIERMVEDAPKDNITDDYHDLPTIDNLMDRLEVLVEKRSERVLAREASEAGANNKIEPTIAIKTETAVRKDSQLDDYADVIDDVAVKRAEKLAFEKKQAAVDTDIIENVEHPKVTLVSETPANKLDSVDTVVTKSQKVEMDNALKSALETLHKMTERSA